MKSQREIILRSWLETEFKRAVFDDEKIRMFAAMLKVGHDKGDDPMHILRVCLSAFVCDLIAPEMGEGQFVGWLDRN